MTALVSSALLLATAAPASAAAPIRESHRGTFLSLSSPGCTTGERPCTDVFAGQTKGAGFVCVDVPHALGSFFGCTETGSKTLTVTKKTQTIAPTRVEVVRVECEEDADEEACEVVDSRTVTVSASAVTTGRRVNRVFRSQKRTPECSFSTSFRSRSAPVAGTVTIDGRRHTLTGEAGTSSSRLLLRGCELEFEG